MLGLDYQHVAVPGHLGRVSARDMNSTSARVRALGIGLVGREPQLVGAPAA